LRDLVIEPGQVAGCNHIAVGYRGAVEVIVLPNSSRRARGGRAADGDYITIYRVPEIQMSTGPEMPVA
jgi:4-hydroxy-tetrahydrodipicolinate reductase